MGLISKKDLRFWFLVFPQFSWTFITPVFKTTELMLVYTIRLAQPTIHANTKGINKLIPLNCIDCVIKCIPVLLTFIVTPVVTCLIYANFVSVALCYFCFPQNTNFSSSGKQNFPNFCLFCIYFNFLQILERFGIFLLLGQTYNRKQWDIITQQQRVVQRQRSVSVES